MEKIVMEKENLPFLTDDEIAMSLMLKDIYEKCLKKLESEEFAEPENQEYNKFEDSLHRICEIVLTEPDKNLAKLLKISESEYVVHVINDRYRNIPEDNDVANMGYKEKNKDIDKLKLYITDLEKRNFELKTVIKFNKELENE